MRRRDQHDRKQQTILRLVAEQPQTNAGEDRPHRQQIQRGADQCRGEKTVLPDQRVVEHHRKRDREHPAERTADDAAHDEEIGNEACRHTADEGDRIGKLREEGGDKQKRRRIVPGKIAREILAQQRQLDLLLDVPIIGQRRMAIEHEFSGRPHIDEIGGDAKSALFPDPHPRKIRHREIADIDHDQREAGVEQRRRNDAVFSIGDDSGFGRGHAKSLGAASGAHVLQQ